MPEVVLAARCRPLPSPLQAGKLAPLLHTVRGGEIWHPSNALPSLSAARCLPERWRYV